LSFERGKPGGEGEGQCQAAVVPPPEYAGLVGCAALGGLSALGSPRCLYRRGRGAGVFMRRAFAEYVLTLE
jgi:hypothetical protein